MKRLIYVYDNHEAKTRNEETALSEVLTSCQPPLNLNLTHYILVKVCDVMKG